MKVTIIHSFIIECGGILRVNVFHAMLSMPNSQSGFFNSLFSTVLSEDSDVDLSLGVLSEDFVLDAVKWRNDLLLMMMMMMVRIIT